MALVERVVVCVFDGLRPDMLNAALTPNLMRFANGATWFRQARSVFPSMTRVATASIATGALPQTHGIVGNAFYFPQAIPEHVLDVSVMLLVLVPLLIPTVVLSGIDLVHFGIVIIVNIMIGLVTPPYGLILFVISSLSRTPLRDVVVEILPFVAVLIGVLAVLIVFPGLVLWLPRALGL